MPYETDEVTRLILDTHDKYAFAPIAAMTIGDFRDFLLSDEATTETLGRLAPGITPEMAAAVSKLMRNQDLDRRRAKDFGGHAVSNHDRLAGTPCRAHSAQSPHRRSRRHRGFDPRRTDVWLRRRLHRDQSGIGQRQAGHAASRADRGTALAVRNSGAILRACPCHDDCCR